jgi:probable F420-dependent oxidoreductase
MADNNAVKGARDALGPVGMLLPVTADRVPPAAEQCNAARRLEEAGCRALWTNEQIGGKDALVQLALLLDATDKMVFGTGIANVWARAPQTAHGAAAFLAEAFPNRIVLGLGTGYPFQAQSTGREFGRPLTIMRDYLERMSTTTAPPASDASYLRIIGTNGPKLLALAREVADGAIPVMMPPKFTEYARNLLGPEKLLVMMIPVVPDQDLEKAREAARAILAPRVSTLDSQYVAALRRVGYSLDQIRDVSDALVDSIIAHGDTSAIRRGIDEHLAAGADHVVLMPSGLPFAEGIDSQVRLVRALAG